MILLLEETISKHELIWIVVCPKHLPPSLIWFTQALSPLCAMVGWRSRGSSQGFYGPPAHPDLVLWELPECTVMVNVSLLYTQPTGTHQLWTTVLHAKHRLMPAVVPAAVNLGFIKLSWVSRKCGWFVSTSLNGGNPMLTKGKPQQITMKEREAVLWYLAPSVSYPGQPWSWSSLLDSLTGRKWYPHGGGVSCKWLALGGHSWPLYLLSLLGVFPSLLTLTREVL